MTPPLTYTAAVQPSGDVTIVLGEFTHERDSGQLFKATNGVAIRSRILPQWDQHNCELYLQGYWTAEDSKPLHIPAADWPRVKQALDEYGAVQTKETNVESNMYAISETPSSFYIYAHGKPSAAILDKAHGCTRADADELCAELNARAEAERKATEVRVDRVSEKIIVLYVGNRSGGSQCVTITHLPNDGITKAQADQLAAATAEALRGILKGDRK